MLSSIRKFSGPIGARAATGSALQAEYRPYQKSQRAINIKTHRVSALAAQVWTCSRRIYFARCTTENEHDHAGAPFDVDVPILQTSGSRVHADRCLSILLRVRRVSSSAPAEATGLLRILLLRFSRLPAGATGQDILLPVM